MMEMIGFLALVAVGCWLMVCGLLGAMAGYGLSDKVPWPLIVIAIAGAAILVYAGYNSPFMIISKTSV